MEEERPEYAEAIQVGKRRSSLGALSKSKPVTKLKSMFEAKGPALPKPKEAGLLGKLKPVSASHDVGALSASVAPFSAEACQSISLPAPADQVPATPTQPLFNVLRHLPEPEVGPAAASPPPSLEEVRTSPIHFNEALHDEVDTKTVKSPGSAGFLKRMGSSIKKALTPKSSSGKHKAGSPRYAGSDGSNLSPQPSGQLFPTPSSQPSSTSLDLNCRSDQIQTVQAPSPSAGFEIHSAREEQDWNTERSREASVEAPFCHVMSTHGREHASPRLSPTPSCGSGAPDGVVTRLDLSPKDPKSADAAPSVLSNTSIDPMRLEQLDLMTAGGPMAAEDSFVSADANPGGSSSAAPSSPIDGDEALAASLTTSPTTHEGSEDSQTSPPMREVNMGADVPTSPPPFNLPSDNGSGEIDMPGCSLGDELIFPSLTSPAAPAPFNSASPLQSPRANAAGGSDPADVEMTVPDAMPEDAGPAAAAPDSTAYAEPLKANDQVEATQTPSASIDVDMAEATAPKPVMDPFEPSANTVQPVGRRSFGAALGRLDLSTAVVAPDGSGSPRSPEASTPTTFGNGDNFIVGLTPVRPETVAVQPQRQRTDRAALSTVAEGPPEAAAAPPNTEGHADVMAEEQHGMDIELAAEPAPTSPAVKTVGDTPSDSAGLSIAALPYQLNSSSASSAVPSSAGSAGDSNVPAAQPAAAEDMDWDGDGDGDDALPAVATASIEPQQETTATHSAQNGESTSASPGVAAAAASTEAEMSMDGAVPDTAAAAVESSTAAAESSPSELACVCGSGSTELWGGAASVVEAALLSAQTPEGDADHNNQDGPRSPMHEVAAPAEQARELHGAAAGAATTGAEAAMNNTDGPLSKPHAEITGPGPSPFVESTTVTGDCRSSNAAQEVPAASQPNVNSPKGEPAIAGEAATQQTVEIQPSSSVPGAEATVDQDSTQVTAVAATQTAASMSIGTLATGCVEAFPVYLPSELDTDMADAEARVEATQTNSATASVSLSTQSEAASPVPQAAADMEPVCNPISPADNVTNAAAGGQQLQEEEEQSLVTSQLAPKLESKKGLSMEADAAEVPAQACETVAALTPDGADESLFGVGKVPEDATEPSHGELQPLGVAAVVAVGAQGEPACQLPGGEAILDSGAGIAAAESLADAAQSAAPGAVALATNELADPVAVPSPCQEPSSVPAKEVECSALQEVDQEQSAACHDAGSDLMEVDISEAPVQPSPLRQLVSESTAQQTAAEEPVCLELAGQRAAAPGYEGRWAEVEAALGAAPVPCAESQQAVAVEVDQVEELALVAAAASSSVSVCNESPAPLTQLQQQAMEQDYDLVAFGSAASELPYLEGALAAAISIATTAEPGADDARSGQVVVTPSPLVQTLAVAIDSSEPAVTTVSEDALEDAPAQQANGIMPLSPPGPQPPQVPASAAVADDPMMVSPLPLRLCVQPLLVPDQAAQPASPLANAPASAHSAGTPGIPTPISPETARIGVRAFQLEDIEEPDVVVEPQVTTGAPEGDQPPPHDGQVATAGLSVARADEAFAGTDASAVVTRSGAGSFAARGKAAGTSSASAHDGGPGAVYDAPSGAVAAEQAGDVPMADSLEAIEALWGNDDLLGEGAEDAGSLASPLPMPQAASSPISASKLAASQSHTGSTRKVAPDVVLQVQRESLDLFSLRNSCAARVSDSLMVESLDSFEGAGICAKSRAIGFVPMAPVNEAGEQEVEEDAGSPVGFGSYGGAPELNPAAAPPVSQPSPSVTFAAVPRGSPLSEGIPTPGLQPMGATAAGTPSANKPAATGSAPRGGLQTPASGGQGKGAPPSGLKTATTPASATSQGPARTSAAPSTALKAMAAANACGASGSKPLATKRTTPPAPAPAKPLVTPGQSGSGSGGGAPATAGRLSGIAATPVAGGARPTATAAKPFMPSPLLGTTPGAGVRTGLTPRGAVVLPPSALGARASSLAQAHAGTGRPGTGPGLFDTPLILRAAAAPLADSPFPGCDFDLDTVDISAEASRAIAMLGAGEAADPAAAQAATTTQATPVLAAAARTAATAATPTLSVMETHVQLLTTKLAETEALLHRTQEENAMLRDQLSTLQFESSMTNDLDMEREARQFLEQELAVVRHRNDGMEAELRTTAEQLATLKAKDAEATLHLQQMQSELDEKRLAEQQAEARAAEVEAKCQAALAEARSAAAAASAERDEAAARAAEMQGTLGIQAHQLVQVQRARDEAEAKFQKAMEQLIATQTAHKKQVVEYESKLQQQNTIMAQFVELRERYKQMKQYVTEADQRVQRAEAKAQETATALATAQVEKSELMRMCNELLTQLEASKAKGGR